MVNQQTTSAIWTLFKQRHRNALNSFCSFLLGRERQLAAVVFGDHVVVEEVAVEQGLEGARNVHDPVVVVVGLVVRPVHLRRRKGRGRGQ